MAASLPIPFALSSRPGAFPREGQGRLVNCFADKDGSATFWRRVPGLSPFATLPQGGVRGALVVGNGVYIATAYGMTVLLADGTKLPVYGLVTGSGPITIARNNKTPLADIVMVTSSGALVLDQAKGGVIGPYSTGVATSDFTPADMPQPNSVAFGDGYFFFTTAGGLIYASNLNSTDVDALSFNKDQPPSHSGGLLRGVWSGQQYYAFGPDNTEVYQDAGTSPFPLSRAAVIPIGLLGAAAVSGFEDGWSGSLIFVASDGTVRSMDGYTPTRISIRDVERSIGSASPSDLQACVYTEGGNSIWSLSGLNWTWEYNVDQAQWYERRSVGLQRWRGGVTVKAFDQWLVADLLSAQMAVIDPKAYDELGTPLVWEQDSAAVKAFPKRLRVPDAMFEFVVGQGIEGSSDDDLEEPEVEISWSHDGGETWGNPLLRSLGRQGQFRTSITVRRLGITTQAGIRFRLRIADARPTTFLGASLDANARQP